MNWLIGIGLIVGIWALAVFFALVFVAAATKEPCVCTYYEDLFDPDCEDCD